MPNREFDEHVLSLVIRDYGTSQAGFGLLCGVGLYLIGVPYAALWGTVAAFFRLVPYIGSVAAGSGA